ncbi:hypothetical protein BDQ17DRAFT_392981 [Cyathus striatus]|nr:hypothetical protein BDQ17DRAFT_392981 [Cyathus striatus]
MLAIAQCINDLSEACAPTLLTVLRMFTNMKDFSLLFIEHTYNWEDLTPEFKYEIIAILSSSQVSSLSLQNIFNLPSIFARIIMGISKVILCEIEFGDGEYVPLQLVVKPQTCILEDLVISYVLLRTSKPLMDGLLLPYCTLKTLSIPESPLAVESEYIATGLEIITRHCKSLTVLTLPLGRRHQGVQNELIFKLDIGILSHLQVIKLNVMLEFSNGGNPLDSIEQLLSKARADNVIQQIIIHPLFDRCFILEPSRSIWTGLDALWSGKQFSYLQKVYFVYTPLRAYQTLTEGEPKSAGSLKLLLNDCLPKTQEKGLLDIYVDTPDGPFIFPPLPQAPSRI